MWVNNSSGNKNTFIGHHAGFYTNITGIGNTFLGYYADENGDYSNATAIGNGAVVTASNTMMLGNAASAIYCNNMVWGTSDGRFKINVTENVKGLEFINKLRPVTYQMNTKALDDFVIQNMPDSIKTIHQQGIDFTSSSSVIRSGFIAQEVEQAGIEAGFVSDIVHTPTNSTDPYALAYAEIVVPLVKAVQELSKTQDSLKAVISALTVSNKSMQMPNNGGNEDSTKSRQFIKLELPDAATLGNAQPNPNNGSTQISYYVPENTSEAKIIFTDMLGKVMEEKPLQPGYGLLNIDTQSLPNGTYSYSMVIDGRVIDSKQMIRKK
jgi:hypothetical protein